VWRGAVIGRDAAWLGSSRRKQWLYTAEYQLCERHPSVKSLLIPDYPVTRLFARDKIVPGSFDDTRQIKCLAIKMHEILIIM